MNGFNTTHSARGSLFSRHGWIRACHRLDERRRRFMHVPWAGGVVLVACVAAAMLLANLPWTAELYEKLLHTDLSLLVRTPDGRIDLADLKHQLDRLEAQLALQDRQNRTLLRNQRLRMAVGGAVLVLVCVLAVVLFFILLAITIVQYVHNNKAD